jgi:hypothetical protein
MKLKLIRFTLLVAIAGAAFATFSSFIATDEGDNSKWKAAVGNGCTYLCATQLFDGSWIYWNVPGTFTTCQTVTYQSSCTSTSCAPINPCVPNN